MGRVNAVPHDVRMTPQSPETFWPPGSSADTDWISWAQTLPYYRDFELEYIEFISATAIFQINTPALTPDVGTQPPPRHSVRVSWP